MINDAAIARDMKALTDRVAKAECEMVLLATMLGVTIGTLDRPGHHRMTLTEALLTGINKARESGVQADVLNSLRSALEIGSEPTPPKGDGTPLAIVRSDEGERKAAKWQDVSPQIRCDCIRIRAGDCGPSYTQPPK